MVSGAGTLTDVLQRIKQAVGSQPGTSPVTVGNHLSPHAASHLDSTGPQIPTPPTYPSLGRQRPSTAGSPGFGSISQFAPTSQQQQTYSTSPLASTSNLPYPPIRRTSLSSSSARGSALDALAHLASSASPDVHRFASHMRQPIQALQDAVEQLNEGETSADDGPLEGEGEHEGASSTAAGGGDRKPSLGHRGASTALLNQAAPSSSDPRGANVGADKDARSSGTSERPAKRARVARPMMAPTPDQFDLVAKGLISDTEARALVLL